MNGPTPSPPRSPDAACILLTFSMLGLLGEGAYLPLGYQLSLGGGIVLILACGASLVAGLPWMAWRIHSLRKRGALGELLSRLPASLACSVALALAFHGALLCNLACAAADECSRGI